MYLEKNNEISGLHITMQWLKNNGFNYGMSMEDLFFACEFGIGFFSINQWEILLVYPYLADNFLEYRKQRIPLSWLSHSYGNKRAYFVCPECSKNATKLHNLGSVFMCGKCYTSLNKPNSKNEIEIVDSLPQKTQILSMVERKPVSYSPC